MIARRLLTVGYAIVAFAAVAGIVLLIPAWAILPSPYDALPDLPAKPAFIVFWIVSVVAVIYTIRKFSPYRVAISMGVIAYLAMIYIYIFAMPAAEAYRGEKPFGYAVLNKIGGSTDHLVLFKTEGPLFYLDPPKPLPEFDDKQDLKDAIAKGDAKWMIVRRRDMPKLDTPTTVELSEASYPWENDYNYPKQGSAGPPRQLIWRVDVAAGVHRVSGSSARASSSMWRLTRPPTKCVGRPLSACG